MDGEQDEGKEPGNAAYKNAIIEHIAAAKNALDDRDYSTARREIQQALEKTDGLQDNIVAEVLASSQFKVNYASNIGADVGSAVSLLRDAKLAHEAKNYEMTLELALRCQAEAERAKERYKELVELIFEAESLISEAHTVGKDTAEAEMHLSKAVTSKSRNGANALAEAAKSLAAVSRILGRSPPRMENITMTGLEEDTSLDQTTMQRLEEIVLSLKEVSGAVQLASSKGINMYRSERSMSNAFDLVKKAIDRRAMDFNAMKALVQSCRTALEEEIELSNPVVRPDLELKGLFSRSLRFGEWNNALLLLHNTGETAALEVSVKLTGGIELEDLASISQLAALEKRKVRIRLRPHRPGRVLADIQVTFKRAYDGKTLESKHPVELFVK